MKKYISLFILFLIQGLSIGWAQIPEEFDRQETPHYYDLTFTDNVKWPTGLGDLVIGAFTVHADSLVCIGSLEIPEANLNGEHLMEIFEEGPDDPIGNKKGEAPYFYLYSPSMNCGSPFLIEGYITSGNYFESPGSFEITNILMATYGLNYPNNGIACPGDGMIVPGVSGPVFSHFKAPEGLVLDSITGIVDANASQSGNYQIEVHYINSSFGFCFGEKKVSFTIGEVPAEGFNTAITDETCEEIGRISVSSSAQGIFTYELNGMTQNHGLFEGLTAGDYNLLVTDAQGCSFEKKNLVIKPATDCDPVDGAENSEVIYLGSAIDKTEVQFETTGTINIVNKYGQLVNSLQAPLTWNGTDQNGNPLGLGLYFVVFEDGTVKHLKVYE